MLCPDCGRDRGNREPHAPGCPRLGVMTAEGLAVTLDDGSRHVIPHDEIIPRALREAKRRRARSVPPPAPELETGRNPPKT